MEAKFFCLKPLTLDLRRRELWHIRKQEEVLETAEIVQDNDWASNDSVGNRSRRGASWFVKKGPAFILVKM